MTSSLYLSGLTQKVSEVTHFCSSHFFWAFRCSRKSPKDYQGSRIFLGDCRRQVAAIYCATVAGSSCRPQAVVSLLQPDPLQRNRSETTGLHQP